MRLFTNYFMLFNITENTLHISFGKVPLKNCFTILHIFIILLGQLRPWLCLRWKRMCACKTIFLWQNYINLSFRIMRMWKVITVMKDECTHVYIPCLKTNSFSKLFSVKLLTVTSLAPCLSQKPAASVQLRLCWMRL